MPHAPSPLESRAIVAQDLGFALAIALAPIAFAVGAFFEPSQHITSGAAAIAVNAAADPVTNNLHIAGFVLAAFLLPISVVGMARLALPASPWLATVGGTIGLLGWLPFAALAAQDDLTLQMARLGPGDRLGPLWERFNDDATMTLFLVVYIVGHLLAYVLLPIALRRARVIPAWSAWLLVSTTPLTLAFFATRLRFELVGWTLLVLLLAAFVVGSLPVAWATVRQHASTGAPRSVRARPVAEHAAA